ncbi:MAG: IS200/IS605 family transposase [Patescibacteria group bacterium]
MALKYWTGSQTKHRLLYHLVWIPKYRKRVLDGKIVKVLQHYFYEAVKDNGWWIEQMAIMPDHVHMLIQVYPHESVSEVVQKLKGGSSHALRKIYENEDEYVWGSNFWSDGYFAESVGAVDFSTVKRYIKDNRASVHTK